MTDAKLTSAQAAVIAVRLQRAWHWTPYSAAQQAEILARVQRLIARNPNGYLARHWQDIYR